MSDVVADRPAGADVDDAIGDGEEMTPPSNGPPARVVAAQSAGVAALALLIAGYLLKVWSQPRGLTFESRPDGNLISSMVKTIQERGWYLDQPRLGAPFGQQFYDFPHGGESFQLVAIKVLVVLLGDWADAINAYFVLGFGVLAATVFAVLRHLRFGPVIAGVAALIYTFLPYHFAHGQAHLYRSTYVSAPLAVLLLVWVVCWRERFLIDPQRTGPTSVRGNLRRGRVAVAVVAAVVIGGTETMTTAFTITLLATGALVAAIRWREPARLLAALALCAVMGTTFLVMSYPTLNFYRAYGRNPVAAQRTITESEKYALKITRLVTPQPHHRARLFWDLGDKSQEDSPVRSEDGTALGVIGTAGFFGSLYGLLTGRRRQRSLDTRAPWDRTVLREQAGEVTALALLFGSVGGGAVLLAMAGLAQVRVWNRIALLIAFFAMVVVCTWAERLVRAVRSRPRIPNMTLGVLAMVVLAFGLWDGLPPVREPLAKVEARQAQDRAFVGAIEDEMPDGAAILQLPLLEFPEAVPPGRMSDYDPLRAFLADSGTLRWSYGSIKGRPDAAWQLVLRDEVGPVVGLPGLLGMGFTGIWLDTFGYVDDGQEARLLEEEIGAEPMASEDGRFLFWDLRAYRAGLDRTDEDLRAEAQRRFRVEPPEVGA